MRSAHTDAARRKPEQSGEPGQLSPSRHTVTDEALLRWCSTETLQGTKSEAPHVQTSTNCWGLRSASGNHVLCT